MEYTKKFFPNDEEQFNQIYKDTPIADLIANKDQDQDQDEQQIFNTYIHNMFLSL